MKKIPSILLSLVLIVTSVFGAVLASRFSKELQVNVMRYNAKKNEITRKLLAQLTKTQRELDPATLCSYAPPENPEYKGEFLATETKIYVNEGEPFEATLYFKNIGNIPWFGDFSGCRGMSYMRLGTAREQDHSSLFDNPRDPRWLGPNRIVMIEKRVDPGQTATFAFSSVAPRKTDIFREYFQPVLEGSQWFNGKEQTANVDIYVGSYSPQEENKLQYMYKSKAASELDINGDPIIHVSINEQKLRLAFGNTVVREYMISTGTFKTPTPLGTFRILDKSDLRIGRQAPHYRMPKWQHFSGRGHGFHALPYLANDKGVFWKEALNHIGRRVSHGCIRLLPEDAEELYNLTKVGTKVEIHA